MILLTVTYMKKDHREDSLSFYATRMESERLLRFSGSRGKFEVWLRVFLLQNVLHKLKQLKHAF